MTRFFSFTVGLLCWTCAADDSRAAKEQPPYDRQENVVYAEVHGVGLLMDIFTPTGKKNGLGIVQVVSGAWHSDRGKLRDLSRAQVFDIFCRRGYCVFAIRPGSISRFSAPEMMDHLEKGVRWVKARAADYQIDSNQLGLIGASAGGHLGSLLALKNGRPTGQPDASVAAAGIFFPPTDFHDYGGRKINPRSQDRLSTMLRKLAFPDGVDKLNDEQIKEGIDRISPAKVVSENAPPFLIFHGDADSAVPLQQSEVLLSELKEKGIPARLIVKPGGGHPWPTIHEEVGQLADWFDQQLGAPAAETAIKADGMPTSDAKKPESSDE